jgi:hypothetical protein
MLNLPHFVGQQQIRNADLPLHISEKHFQSVLPPTGNLHSVVLLALTIEENRIENLKISVMQ